MFEAAPDFIYNPYFASEPDWHILPEAPDELKKEFEEYSNTGPVCDVYKRSFPDMKHPYYTWEGKIVDIG